MACVNYTISWNGGVGPMRTSRCTEAGRDGWSLPRAWRLALVGALALTTACGGCGEDEISTGNNQFDEDFGRVDMGPDEADTGPQFRPPSTATSVETVLDRASVRAGEEVPVRCELLDQDGEVVTDDDALATSLRLRPSESFERLEQGGYRAVTAGQATLQCSSPKHGLVDDTPATLTIEPGPPHTTVTALESNLVTAGDTFAASCSVFDAYGNEIVDAMPELQTSPSGGGVMVDGLQGTIESAGIYDVSCDVDGADEVIGDVLEVVPGLPAMLVISKIPDQNVYGLGSVVTIGWIVTDRFGNEIPDARVELQSTPAAERFGADQFRFSAEGTYVVQASVAGPTEGMTTLTDSVEIIVNGVGPAISCSSPIDGDMLDLAPGTKLDFRGAVSDVHGVQQVDIAINGSTNRKTIIPQPDGSFKTSLVTRYGINFVNISSTDTFGEQNSKTCAFLATDTWNPEGDFLDDAVALRMAQDAIDDGAPASPIRSLTDILREVLNSQGLLDVIDGGLADQNPLFDRTFVGFIDIKVEYAASRSPQSRRIKLSGVNAGMKPDNTVSLTLRDNNDGLGDLGAVIRIEYIEAFFKSVDDLKVDGWAEVSGVDIEATFDLELQNGNPKISLNTVQKVDVGNVGLRGWTRVCLFGYCFEDLVADLLQNTLQSTLEGILEDFLRTQINDALDGIVSSLDPSALGASFDVPRLDGGATTLEFGFRFSRLDTSSLRAVFGLGTKFTTSTPGHARPSLGVPLPSGPVYLEPQTNEPMAASLHIGMLNQVLHRLWRSGWLDLTIGGDTLGGGLPSGVQATMVTRLPPVFELMGGGQVRLMLGAVDIDLVYPGIFDDPLAVTLGATATATVSLNNDVLDFGAIQLEELVFSTDEISLSSDTRMILEDFLRSLLQSVVDSSLNDALPTLPIPSFTIPNSLSTFGLTAGNELGLDNPNLRQGNGLRHFILEGVFGEL
jgi:hypothetical protein